MAMVRKSVKMDVAMHLAMAGLRNMSNASYLSDDRIDMRRDADQKVVAITGRGQ
jgi:hypothetical protein